MRPGWTSLDLHLHELVAARLEQLLRNTGVLEPAVQVVVAGYTVRAEKTTHEFASCSMRINRRQLPTQPAGRAYERDVTATTRAEAEIAQVRRHLEHSAPARERGLPHIRPCEFHETVRKLFAR